MSLTGPKEWSLPFLDGLGIPSLNPTTPNKTALIILNQSFSFELLHCLWKYSHWNACADGGANRLYDILPGDLRKEYKPDLIKGDFDSLRADVRKYYTSQGVPIEHDPDQYSTDLMKCISNLTAKEAVEGDGQYDIIILGGLGGRLDQTAHTLSYLHKLRKTRDRVFVITDDSVAWVLDSGEHNIHVNHSVLGQTCGLLPFGIDWTILTTTGLRWNLTQHESSFDGLVSTSNHLVPEEPVVYINTTKPIWWTAELRQHSGRHLKL